MITKSFLIAITPLFIISGLWGLVYHMSGIRDYYFVFILLLLDTVSLLLYIMLGLVSGYFDRLQFNGLKELQESWEKERFKEYLELSGKEVVRDQNGLRLEYKKNKEVTRHSSHD